MFPSMNDKINTAAIEESLDGIKFEIGNPAEVEPFLSAFKQAVVKGEKTKYFIVRVNALSNKDVDALLHQVDSVLAAEGKYIMAITGTNDPIHSNYINLVQNDAAPAAVAQPKYLNPLILSGILIMLFIFSIFMFGLYQLMQVQTPEIFLPNSLDFGKLEK